MSRKWNSGLCCLLLAMGPGWAVAADVVEGLFTADGLTNGKAVPHGWAVEKLYLGQLDTGFGFGAECGRQGAGRFRMVAPDSAPALPAGTYALFALSYDGAPAFSLNPSIRIAGTATRPAAVTLNAPAHYSVMYNVDYHDWSDHPWIRGTDFYQTFVATSPYITRLAVKLADKSGDHQSMTLNYAVYQPNDGPPSTWKQISPVRDHFLSGGTDPIMHVFWVPYRSNEVSLVPGKRYAVRFWRDPKSASETFAIVVREDKGDGYAGGHLYAGDTVHKNLDVYAYISGGEPGTVVNHAPVGDMDFKRLVGTAKRFGQTFRASGTSLAAVDVVYATGEARPPALPIAFQLYDKLDGKPIGPAKTCYGLPLAFQGRAAAVWSRGQAPLIPGKEFYIEWSSPGCNTWQLNEDLPGEAYLDGQPKPGADLAMSIVEYVGGKPATGQ